MDTAARPTASSRYPYSHLSLIIYATLRIHSLYVLCDFDFFFSEILHFEWEIWFDVIDSRDLLLLLTHVSETL